MRYAMVVLMMLMCGVAEATVKPAPVVNNYTEVTKVEQHSNNSFDYGLFADVVFYETPNSEWGLHSTYAYQDNETRVYAGGKIYLNRATYQKK